MRPLPRPSDTRPVPLVPLVHIRLARLPWVLAAALALASPAAADVLVVGPKAPLREIQEAVDQAQDRDVIVVLEGTYQGFTIDGKSLYVLGATSVPPQVFGGSVVRNVPLGGLVVLSRLSLNGTLPDPPLHAALTIEGSLGHVRVAGCTLRGGGPGFLVAEAGREALVVRDSLRVDVLHSTLIGGRGVGDGLSGDDGGNGGVGLRTRGSSVALHSTQCTGGEGGPGAGFFSHQTGGAGGNGAAVEDYGLFASASHFMGGRGASAVAASPAGAGGHGLNVHGPAQAQLFGCTFAGGWGVPVGQPIVGSGLANQHAVSPRRLLGPSIAHESQPLTLTLQGLPGDQVWIVGATRPGRRYSQAHSGIWLVPFPAAMTLQPAGVVPASGSLAIHLLQPDLLPAEPLRTLFLQAYVVSASGQPFLSGGVQPVLLNCGDLLPDCNANGRYDLCDFLLGSPDCDGNGVIDACDPDCNANGVPDGCDIVNGTSPDLNGNNVPDECELLPTWHVDDSAAPGGDGSAAHPFQSLGEAFAVSTGGDTILVADGLYAGSENRGFDFGSREITVRSLNGPAGCIIDCEGAARAFRIAGGQHIATAIQGLTISNGFGSLGGGIWIEGASVSVEDCVFRGCTANSGGGLFVGAGGSSIRGCRFEDNIVTQYGGGLLVNGDSDVEGCEFLGNRAQLGGGLRVWSGTVRVSNLRFFGNHATSYGGGMYSSVVGFVTVDHALFAGNTAVVGAAAAHVRGAMSDCTLVDNVSGGTLAASILTMQHPSAMLSNVILWNNVSSTGVAVRNDHNLLVEHCDIQGGMTVVTPGVVLTWGPGNIDADPLFVDPDGPDNDPLTLLDNDWRLGPGSPCVDAGNNAAVPPDVFDLDGDGDTSEPVPFDLDGLPRFVDDPLVPDTGTGTPPIVDMGPYERP